MIKNNTLYVVSREEWREWLEKNHREIREIWLIYYKKHTGKPSIQYNVSVEEALCFGWIDSIIKKIDTVKYARKFTPRTNTKKWSESNKLRIKNLIESGKMTQAGLEKIDENILIEKPSPKKLKSELPFPVALEKILKKNKKAWNYFFGLAPSHRRLYILWITGAKKDETRLKRLNEAMKLLEKNEKLGLK
jgi:uncharacterized protein YdeI (YjbR/CyaY-like superfamily)